VKISGSLPYFAGLDFSVAIAGWRRFNSVVVIAAITFIGYYIGAELALVLRIPATRSSIFWIPNAVLLTVLLATAPRRWCLWLLAALPAHILAQSRSDGAAVVVLAPFAANVLQVTLAAFALRCFGVTLPRFDALRETILFVCIAALLAPATASLAAGLLFVNVGWEKDIWLVSSGRFLNNVTTGLTVAPLLLLGASAALGKAGQLNSRRIIEYVLLVSILIGVLYLAREWRSAEIHKIPVQLYLPLPFLIWAAVRFGVGGLSVCLLAVAVCSIADALEGRGPYTFEAPADNLLALQVSLTVLSVPLIFLASAMTERRKNDAALQSSEERYRNVVEDQTELVCRYLPNATLTFVNSAYARYFGRSAEQLIGSSFLDLIPEAQREAAGAYLRGLVEISAVGSHEHEVLTPHGEQRWQHWVDRPILDSSGRVIEFQGVGRDITDRKRAETRLEVQYAVTRVLAEADSLADASSRILQAVCAALDSDLGEIWREDGDYGRLILDQTWHRPQASLAAFAEASRHFSFSHGEGLPGWAWQNGKPVWISEVGNSQYFQRKTLAAAAGLHSAFAVRVGVADQTTFVLVFFSRRIKHHDSDLVDTLANIGEQIGQFVGRSRAEALVRDNEKLLRQKDEQLARTQRFSSVMVTHTSLEGRWLKVPPTFCDLLGYAEDELLGRRFHEFTHPDDIEKDWEQCQRLNREEIKSFELEKRYLRKDRTLIWVSLNVSMVTDLDGRPLHFLSYIRDISERKHAEETLKSAFGEVKRLKERLENENVVLRAEVSGAHREDQIIGRSLAIRKIMRQIQQVARTDTSVLILGETGTGKELVARAVHRQSFRNGHPMVGINCAALPEMLMESELFGHEKGAFTGAGSRMMGRFEIADGGSIFLDEIGDLPLSLQAKLLRVLQEGEFQRLGSGKTIKTSVRIIAATNRNLSEAMRKGTFRTDLYYRLAVYPINVPPLRAHKEDIALLAERFLREAGRRLGRSFDRVPAKVVESLVSYDWPGNVRELQNVVERAAVISAGEDLRLPDEWMQVTDVVKPLQSTGDGADLPASPTVAKGSTLDDLERNHILCILRETRWRIEGPKGAASILGIRPSTLRSRMSKLGIQRYSNV
jgi:PAS domain S-box-containing protein